MDDRVDDAEPSVDRVLDLCDGREEEAVPMVEGAACVLSQPDRSHADRLPEVSHLDTVVDWAAHCGDGAGLAAAEDPAMEEGRVRNVERVLQRGVQAALEVAPEDHLTGAGAFDRGEGEWTPSRFGIRLSPGPHDAVVLDCGMRRDLPGVGRRRTAVGESGDSHALSAAVVGPAVITALEHTVVGDPPQ